MRSPTVLLDRSSKSKSLICTTSKRRNATYSSHCTYPTLGSKPLPGFSLLPAFLAPLVGRPWHSVCPPRPPTCHERANQAFRGLYTTPHRRLVRVCWHVQEHDRSLGEPAGLWMVAIEGAASLTPPVLELAGEVDVVAAEVAGVIRLADINVLYVPPRDMSARSIQNVGRGAVRRTPLLTAQSRFHRPHTSSQSNPVRNTVGAPASRHSVCPLAVTPSTSG